MRTGNPAAEADVARRPAIHRDISMEFSWAGADAYERYVGRWSRGVAAELLWWLDLPPGLDWVDVGCGTGALSATILTLPYSPQMRFAGDR